MSNNLDIIFGKCPVCGGGGTNDPDPGSAFSASDHSGIGYYLIYYHGKLMCKLCKDKAIAKQEDKIMLAGHLREQRFRDKVGVKRYME